MNKGNFIVQLAINIATWIAFFSMNNASFRDSALSLGEIGGANGLPVFYSIPLVIIFIFAVYDVYKIAVVQGSAHVATSTYLRKQGYKSNREFINWDPERHSLKFAFSYFNEAVRTKVLHPEIEIPLSMKEHVLLESYYGIFVLGDEPKAKNEARQNIATLGDEEVHEVLEGLDPLMQNTKKAWMLAFRLRRHLKKRVERTQTH